MKPVLLAGGSAAEADRPENVPEARHRFVLGFAPAGAALDKVPAGYRDYVTAPTRRAWTAPASGSGVPWRWPSPKR